MDVPSPRVPANVQGLSVAIAYIPAGRADGPPAGDFVDLIDLDGQLAIVVGDVAGHGAGVTEQMWALRESVRVLAVLDPYPSTVLRALDAVQGQLGPDAFSTLWYGLYDAASGLLRYASAGHPPPILCNGESAVLLEFTVTPPLGTGFNIHPPTHELTLTAGCVLVGYSDGLIERPEKDLEGQIELLRDTVRDCVVGQPTVSELDVCQVVLGAFVGDPDAVRDDICLVVVIKH